MLFRSSYLNLTLAHSKGHGHIHLDREYLENGHRCRKQLNDHRLTSRTKYLGNTKVVFSKTPKFQQFDLKVVGQEHRTSGKRILKVIFLGPAL